MGKGSKSDACKSASHQLFKDRAKNRVDDLQGMFSDLQSARKDSRSNDVAVLEEQVHQMLREWKSELNEPSPASSLQSLGSFSSDIYRLLQLCEEEDDATSALAAPKSETDGQKVDNPGLQEVHMPTFTAPQLPQEQSFQLPDQCKNSPAVANNMGISSFGVATQLDYHNVGLHPNFEQQYYANFDVTGLCGQENALSQIAGYAQNLYPPPAAFLGPKCALWDCPRPAQRLEWCQTSHDYCSGYHANLAPAEGYPGMAPVLRPGGIGLKDNLLFAALCAKSQGKEVGVPECEGAATAKSPWNATELFDLAVLEGETIREWLFFDKPRRAFESGNRKQRALPDYNGRGWHESRKQTVNEYGGLKRSYYMDPQPMKNYEWHLYEYEINKYDACALYRLELKLVEGKKTPKGKIATDPVPDLQKQMTQLNTEVPSDSNSAVKDGAKANSKEDGKGSIYSTSNRVQPTGEGLDYGSSGSGEFLVDNGTVYYIT